MIGIICAMKEELNEVVNLMKDPSFTKVYTNEFYTGTINNIQCVCALSGVGKVNSAMCTQTLIIKYNPKMILNIGVAGSIDKNIKIGDVVIAKATIQHDFDISAFPHRKKGEISGVNSVEIKTSQNISNKLLTYSKKLQNIKTHYGIILTGDQFISSKSKLTSLKKEFGGIACEMEAGSIAQVCFLNNIPFGIVRAISDCADNSSPIDFKSFIKNSSKNASLLVNEFTKSL